MYARRIMQEYPEPGADSIIKIGFDAIYMTLGAIVDSQHRLLPICSDFPLEGGQKRLLQVRFGPRSANTWGLEKKCCF